MKTLADKVIVITGASSGIGKALAEACAVEKAKIVLAARREEKLVKIATKLKSKGCEVLICPTDVSKEDQCKRLMDSAISAFGRIDVLVNNAGISMRAMFKDLELQVLRDVMDVNFWGTVYCTKHALDSLLQNAGTIVGISSVAGYRGLPGRTGYSASKFAMHGFLEALRTEHYNDDLDVLLVCPGFTASEIREAALTADGQKQGRSPMKEQNMMTAEEVANEILSSIKNAQRSKVLTRQGKLTVLLNRFMPGFMDKMVYNHFKKEEGSPMS